MTVSAPYDITLTEGDDGELLAHHLDCPMVEAHRAQNRPIMTLMGCTKPLVTWVNQHSCLEQTK